MGKSRGLRAENRLANVSLAVLAMAVTVLVGYTLISSAASNAQLAAAAQPLPKMTATVAERPQVAFIGDSYTGGSKMNSGTASLWSTLLAEKFHFVVHLFIGGGSGFIATGQKNQPLGAYVPDVVALHPDVVVVEGGHNDVLFPDAPVQTTARGVLTRLRAGLPKAQIIVIGPIWPSGDVPKITRDLSQDMRRFAAEVGARFVDPIADGWFRNPASLIGVDGVHPTDAGHLLMAKRLEPVFAATVSKVAS